MKTNLPVPPFSEFRNFLAAILRKWEFLLLLFLDIAALIIGFISPEFSLPEIYYLGFVFAGFIASAFHVYRDLRSAYQSLIPVPVEKIPKSELSLSFVVGDEYTYSISDPYSGQNRYITKMQKTRGAKCRFDEKGVFYIDDMVYYVLPQENLEINIRIENSGDLPLDVSAFRSENNLNLRYLVMFDGEAFVNGTKLRFPLHLKRGEFVILQSRSRIFSSKGSSTAEFAADSRSLPKSILHEISFDTIDVEGKRQTYVSKIETSSKPLKDLYVTQWREFYQEEYLVIAGYSLIPDP
jgi:hypothetical protein